MCIRDRFSPDGTRLVAADHSSVLIWRTDITARPERHDVHGGRVSTAEWSADGGTLATLGVDGGVVLLDMTGKRRVGAVLTDALGARTTTLWATEQAIVVGQVTGRLLFVSPLDGTIEPAAERPHGTNAIDSARAGPSGERLITTDYLGASVWDLADRRLLGSVELLTDPPSPDPSSDSAPPSRMRPSRSRGTPSQVHASWKSKSVSTPPGVSRNCTAAPA